MNRRSIWAIVKKDLKEVLANKMVVLPMVLVPAILCIVLPVVGTLAALGADMSIINGSQFIERLIPFYGVPEHIEGLSGKILYIFLNYTFVPFFMLVPVMVTSVVSANSIVGEKERHTLETLLYTPVTNREFLVAKMLTALLPAVVVAIISFVLFLVGANAVSFAMEGYMIVGSPIWIPAMLLLMPSVAGLGLSVGLLVSLKSKSFMEAQQWAGILVLPIVILVGVQVSGLLILRPIYIVILAGVLFAITYVLISKIGPRFERERVVSTL